MSHPRPVVVRAAPYGCFHRFLGVPYWLHRAYSLEIVGHGWTQAPSKRKVREWVVDWLTCNYEKEEEWQVIVIWN